MRAEVGDKVWSPYFGQHLIVTAKKSDKKWRFRKENGGQTFAARTPLSWFEERGYVVKNKKKEIG